MTFEFDDFLSRLRDRAEEHLLDRCEAVCGTNNPAIAPAVAAYLTKLETEVLEDAYNSILNDWPACGCDLKAAGDGLLAQLTTQKGA